jgi:hypothetical protein
VAAAVRAAQQLVPVLLAVKVAVYQLVTRMQLKKTAPRADIKHKKAVAVLVVLPLLVQVVLVTLVCRPPTLTQNLVLVLLAEAEAEAEEVVLLLVA